MQVGVFGSSLNPPTMGHINVLEQSLMQFSRVFVIPARKHAFHKALIPIHHRMNMLRLALQSMNKENQQRIEVLDIEAKLLTDSEQPIYTYDVLEAVSNYCIQNSLDYQLSFIIGPDLAKPNTWQKFYRYQDIEKKWPIHIVEQEISVRSEIVRTIIKKYSEDLQKVKVKLHEYVGDSVADYIIEHKLYF